MSKLVFARGAALATVMVSTSAFAAPFKVFMISSTAQDHLAMSAAARTALAQMGQMNDFTVDATTDPSLINETNLARYQVFLQMHLAPFEIKVEQRAALEHFVQEGKGWVGVHAAGLIIPSEYGARNLPNWDFYSNLIGGVSYVTHPALQNGTIVLEDRTHPATKNLPMSFQIRDEWYEWSKNPRPAVRVLGRADETTYRQVRPMGDHPMIWACETYQRAIYISTGHDASDWNNPSYNILIRDALLWASGASGPASDAGTDVSVSDASSGSRDGSSDVSSPTDGGTEASKGSGGSGGAGSEAGPISDGAAGSAVSAGAGGSGSGGSGGTQDTGSAGLATTTSSTSTSGSGGVAPEAGGSGSNAAPTTSSEGCACRIRDASRPGAASNGTTRDPSRGPLFLIVGLGLAARRRRALRSMS